MPYYVKRGSIPHKRHTQFRRKDGTLYKEELVSREGFSSIYSNLYHIHPPTAVTLVGEFRSETRREWQKPHRHHHFHTAHVKTDGDALTGRSLILFNDDVALYKAHIVSQMTTFCRNVHMDELFYIHRGEGTLHSQYGDLPFGPGDYIVIPRGVIWKMMVASPCRALVIETSGPIETPDRYRNRHGQLEEWSPYCERDLRVPDFTEATDEVGEFPLTMRLRGGWQDYTLNTHPFDLVGWDGYYYPWIFNIGDFEPITGRIHQPPPVHQTFQAPGLVICSFVPRLFDYHPLSIPAPYAHSNVDSEEVIYYVEGRFMSRKGIEEESITFHPAGPPHGPQPGRTEASIGQKETTELAVMLDTFRPLKVAEAAAAIDDPGYPYSWITRDADDHREGTTTG